MQRQRHQTTHIHVVQLRQRQARGVGEGARRVELVEHEGGKHALDLQAPVVEVLVGEDRAGGVAAALHNLGQRGVVALEAWRHARL